MKKALISIILFLAGSAYPFMAMPTRAGQGISYFAQNRYNAFLELPDKKNYFAALGAGYGLSFAAFGLGKKYLPPMGYIRVGRITIPVKPWVNFALSDTIGYSPLIGYIYYNRQVKP